MRINEFFKGVQGEGFFAGLPVYFVRTAGCNTNCDFCDTKYHKYGNDFSVEEVVNKIRDSKLETIVFTGGEPTIQIEDIAECMSYLPDKQFHLETNGSLYKPLVDKFDFINCSPKEQQINLKLGEELESYKKFNSLPQTTFKFVYENRDNKWWINFMNKVGVDNKKVLIMPEGATRKDQLKKMPEVMEYCIENNFMFSPRLHVLAYGTRRGV